MPHLYLSDTLSARELLGRAARALWGMETLPPIGKRAGGKPWFPTAPERCFNLSHSGPYALCALDGREVGADVEVLRPRRALLPRKLLSDEEYAWFSGRGGRWEDFYTLWTLKEAKVKCLGTGLTLPVRAIAVPLLEPGECGALEGLFFTAYAGAGWRAALCAFGGSAFIKWLGDS